MSGVPGEEIGKQTQTRRLAFFRVELHGKNILAGQGGGKRQRIVCDRGDVSLSLWANMVAMDEIEPAARGNS